MKEERNDTILFAVKPPGSGSWQWIINLMTIWKKDNYMDPF
jgi:hypothetical protein